MNLRLLRQELMAEELEPWKAYVFAILLTGATFGLRLAFDGSLGGRPLLIVFVLPILLSGYVGGLRGGLLATLLSYLASISLLPPFHRLYVPKGSDHWPQIIVVLIGITISILNEVGIRHSRNRTKKAFQVAEAALVKAKNFQNAIFNCPNFSCIATDANGVIQVLNVGAQRMFECTMEEAVNKMNLADLHDAREVAEQTKSLSAQMGVQIRNGTEALVFKASMGMENVYELVKTRRDGSPLAAVVSITALRDAEGGPIGYLFVATDHTARRQAQEQQMRAAAELEKTNLKLESARAGAVKANLAKSEFLSNMSHELRTPLNAIIGFAQLMESDLPAPTGSQSRSISRIVQSGWYLLKLINEVLDLALIESGKLSLSKEAVSLEDVLTISRNMVETQAQLRGVRMIFPDFETAIFVKADRTRLEQVLINLLSNAVKYNKAQGTVVVECIAMPAGRVRISIKDTGSGLTPDQVAHLFIPFNRLGQEHGDVPGTGIGLVVSKRLTEAMDGSIGVESTVGQGSLFWCDLLAASAPRTAPYTVNQTLLAEDRTDDPRQRTLLYIEDNPANMELIEEFARRVPELRLITAANATTGLELVRSTQPQVILMDINLPGISGIKALRMLRNDPVTRPTPVIALSANAMPCDVQAGLDTGFFSYMTKPVNLKELSANLNAAFQFAEEQRLELARMERSS